MIAVAMPARPVARLRTLRKRGATLGCAIALGALVVLSSAPRAAESGSAAGVSARLLPGVAAHDTRGRPAYDKVPWRAIGKIQAVALNFRVLCTGTLVGPSIVLTAAHCVYNPRTHRNFLPGSLHFLIGYDGSRYAGHDVGASLQTGPGYDPNRPSETRGDDWALISLGTRLGSADRILPMIRKVPEVGSPVMLGGYQQDHPLVLMADTGCHIVGRTTDGVGRPLLQHDCSGTAGDSGAPLLIEQGGKWYIAGVAVAAEYGAAGGLAVVLDEARKRL